MIMRLKKDLGAQRIATLCKTRSGREELVALARGNPVTPLFCGGTQNWWIPVFQVFFCLFFWVSTNSTTGGIGGKTVDRSEVRASKNILSSI